MIIMRQFRRLAYWLHFRSRQNELLEELELHRELLEEDLKRRGLEPNAARTAARRAMGNDTLMREDARGVWLAAGLDSVLKDLSYAWRGLRRSPAFASMVVLTVALTIAANTVVFSVVEHVLLDPLPYPEGNRIVRLGLVPKADPLFLQYGIGTELTRQLRTRSRTLDEFAEVTMHHYRIGDDESQAAVEVASITPSFLPMLRVQPVLGRGFTADDARPAAPPVMLIGFELWQLRYGGAADVIGRVVSVNGAPRTIVGVTPARVGIPMLTHYDPPDAWLPLDLDAASGFEAGFARLTPGATASAASQELQSLVRAMPDTGALNGLRASISTARDLVEPRARLALRLLFVTAGGLLLIACANIANLLLMRGWARQRELATRIALGAGRLRLARQLLTESVLLALLGGALGLLVAWQGLRVLIAIYPGGLALGLLSNLRGVHIDATILAWTTVLTVATGLLFGVGPAFLSASGASGDSLRAGAPAAAGSSAMRRLRNSLVVAEIALSLTFLSAACLLVRSFVELARTPIGLDPTGLANVELRIDRQPVPADRAALEQTLIRTFESIPAVSGAAFGTGIALMEVRPGPFAIEGPAGPQLVDLPIVDMPTVTPSYFRVMRIPLVRGRTFDSTDPIAAAHELVVNQSVARRFWPGGNALGARLRVGTGEHAMWLTVVGIVGDVHLPGLQGDMFTLQMYRPTSASSALGSNMVLRVSEHGSGALVPRLEQALARAGVPVKLGRVVMTGSVIDKRVLARPRFALATFGVFAVLALGVSAAGLYGLIAYAVTQRTREIGVRIALGAEPSNVARLVLADSVRLVAMGGSLGLVGAWAGTRLLGGFLYQVRPTDPAALGGAALLMTAVALIATLVPVLRALRISPVDALRSD
jgi:predicted permease